MYFRYFTFIYQSFKKPEKGQRKVLSGEKAPAHLDSAGWEHRQLTALTGWSEDEIQIQQSIAFSTNTFIYPIQTQVSALQMLFSAVLSAYGSLTDSESPLTVTFMTSHVVGPLNTAQ